MKRNIAVLFTLLVFGFGFGQKNKFEKILGTKKLATTFKNVKNGDKDQFYQQYYWVAKVEELSSYSHLKDIKPVVLYQFVKEIYPPVSTKKYTKEDKELRKTTELALDQFMKRKDSENPLVMYNVETYIDPKGTEYFTRINPEKIYTLIPKSLYMFKAVNKKTGEEKTRNLWINDGKYKIVDVFPPKEDKDFYNTLYKFMPGFKISELVPTVKMGEKKDKIDVEYFYITPFQEGSESIEYKTNDFKTFKLVRYRKVDGIWHTVNPK